MASDGTRPVGFAFVYKERKRQQINGILPIKQKSSEQIVQSRERAGCHKL
jgi:hypothetical protein